MKGMKLWLGLATVLLVSSLYVSTAAAATCSSVATGNWGDASTWSCGTVPSTTDDVVIQDSHVVTITAASSAKTVTIEAGGTLTFGANVALTIQPDANDAAFNLMPGGNFATSGTGTVRLEVNGGQQASIAGNPSFHNLTVVRRGAGRATLNFTGTTLTVGNNLQMNTTTTFTVTDKTVTIGTIVFTNTASTGTEQILNLSNSTVTIGSAIVVSGGSVTFGTINFINADVTVLGNLDPRQGVAANPWTFTGSTITFGGSAEQSLNGNLSFNDAVVASGAVILFISDSVSAATLTNHGRVRQTKEVSGNSDVPFVNTGGYGGVTINANNLDLGTTTVTIRGNQICDTENSSVHRCFEIEPANSSGRNATVTFYVSAAELVGHSCPNLRGWRWTGSEWDFAGANDFPDCDEPAPYSVLVPGVSDFGFFALSDIEGGPTAVQLTTLQTTAATIPAVVFAAVVLLLTGTAVVLRRRP
jgi:hypothetical protein